MTEDVNKIISSIIETGAKIQSARQTLAAVKDESIQELKHRCDMQLVKLSEAYHDLVKGDVNEDLVDFYLAIS